MWVYRVENKEGHGPYRATGVCSYDWGDEPHNGSNMHPTPTEDEIPEAIVVKGDCICGFESIEQLEQWFSPTELRILNDLGFIPVKIESHTVHYGYHQIMFTRDSESIPLE